LAELSDAIFLEDQPQPTTLLSQFGQNCPNDFRGDVENLKVREGDSQ